MATRRLRDVVPLTPTGERIVDDTFRRIVHGVDDVVASIDSAGGGAAATYAPAWQTLYDVDLTAEATAAVATADGAYAIAGKSWYVENFARSLVGDPNRMRLVNGTGLVIVHAATTSLYQTTNRTAPMFSVSIADLIGSAAADLIGTQPFRVTVWVSDNATVTGQHCCFGYELANATSAPWVSAGTDLGPYSRFSGRGWNGGRFVFQPYADVAAVASHDVVALELCGFISLRYFTGVYAGGWPTTLTRGGFQIFPASAAARDLRFTFFARNGTVSSFTSVLKRVRVEAYF